MRDEERKKAISNRILGIYGHDLGRMLVFAVDE